MKHCIILSIIMLLISTAQLYSTEYFLGVNGSDTHPGTAEAKPLATLERAAKLLQPGDTLTILPGEYHQEIFWEFPGSETAVTTVRAKIPGSVHFRGDVSAPQFQPASVKRVYVCSVEKMPEQVMERDTLTKYFKVPSELEVSFTPGSSYFDRENKKVYIHTSDSTAPENHRVTFSMLRGDAFRIVGDRKQVETPVRNLVIDGLTMSGYNSDSPMTGASSSFGGIYIRRPVNAAIRNCTVYLSGSGITLSRPTNTDIDDCRAFCNDNIFAASGGNIICFNPTVNTRIRRCVAFSSNYSGIRMYGGTPAENSLIEDCVVFDNDYGDIWLKYPSDTSIARRCFSSNALHSRLIENSIFSSGDSYYFGKANSSIARSREKKFNPNEQFADPVRFDFRPQSDSMFRYPERGIASFDPNVLFVSASGNDSADGNSVKTALKTFKAAADKLADGGTLYILPGKYGESLQISGKKNLLIRGRGNTPAILSAGATLSDCTGATLENLNLMALQTTSCDNFTLKNCGVSTPVRFTGKTPSLQHNAFAGGVKVISPDAKISANIFVDYCSAFGPIVGSAFAGPVPDNAVLSFQEVPQFTAPHQFTLKNAAQFDGRAIDGMPVGPFQRLPMTSGHEPEFNLNSVSATTANFSFFAPDRSSPVLTVEKRRVNTPVQENFHTLSLTGLKPGTKYDYQLSSSFKPEMRFTSAAAGSNQPYRTKGSFTTAESDQPVTWHVAINGNDQASGLSRETAWRNISHAVLKAKAGDTVLIYSGNYLEKVRVGTTGDVDKRFTIKAAPGEKVFLNGGDKLLSQGILIYGKSHVTIDDIHFIGFLHAFSGERGGIVAINSPNLIISRCFYDGRPPRNSPPFINARNCADMLMENCVILRGFSGYAFSGCRNLEVRHNVFVRNQVGHGYVVSSLEAPSWFHHNIWAGHELQKVHNPIMQVGDVAAFRENDNCFMVRLPKELKPIFGVNRLDGKELPHNADVNPLLTEEWRRQGRFGNDCRSYPEFCKRYQRQETSLFVDAGMKALPSFYQFKDIEDWHRNYIKGQAGPEQKAAFAKSSQGELNMNPDGTRKLIDFSDFFATNPELVKRGIGLQPEAFKN